VLMSAVKNSDEYFISMFRLGAVTNG
jgi:hypothetical protein